MIAKGGAIYITIMTNTNIVSNYIFNNCEGKEGGSLYINCTSLFDIQIINSTFFIALIQIFQF